MVTKAAQAQFGANRGTAGETRLGPDNRVQFSNLYQLNRNPDAVKNEYEKFQSQANEANQTMANAVKSAQFGALGAQGPGNNSIAQYNAQKAANQAADVSNRAEGWSVGGEAMKRGLSPQQAAMASLYAGASNPYVDKIRSFGNLYKNVMDRGAGIFNRTQSTPGQAIPPPSQAPTQDQGGFISQEQADQMNQANRQQYGNTGVNVMSTLDWALKAGRITTEEYYAAQGGPGTAGYEAIKGRLG